MKEKIVLLIPSLNPEKKLISFVREILEKEKQINIVVVDDGSEKRCKEIFDELSHLNRVKILTHEVNKGKGRALKTGFEYYLSQYTSQTSKGIITADSDGQHTIEDILKLKTKLISETEDCVIIGTRNFNEKQVPFKSRYGNKITTIVFKLLYRKTIDDTQSGLRGFSYNIVKKISSLEGERFEYEIMVLIYIAKNNLKLVQLPIETIYFNRNKKSYFNFLKDSLKIYKVIIQNIFK